MAHTELDLRERRLIEDMLVAKASVARIAERLSRHRSTVYREIRRNRFEDSELPELSGYYGVLAQRKAAERRGRQRKLVRMADLLAAVVHRLKAGWSPEQIAGRLRLEGTAAYVCHETTYADVYSRRARARAWHVGSRSGEGGEGHAMRAGREAWCSRSTGPFTIGHRKVARDRPLGTGNAI